VNFVKSPAKKLTNRDDFCVSVSNCTCADSAIGSSQIARHSPGYKTVVRRQSVLFRTMDDVRKNRCERFDKRHGETTQFETSKKCVESRGVLLNVVTWRRDSELNIQKTALHSAPVDSDCTVSRVCMPTVCGLLIFQRRTPTKYRFVRTDEVRTS